jgi:hypothetical protein
LAALLRTIEPFDHGVWLVAYLFLVGFLAQLLLVRGRARLRDQAGLPAASTATCRAEVGLWNLGVVLVPLGVLAETRLAVCVGSVTLLAALGTFARSVAAATHADTRPRAEAVAYRMLLGWMAASSVIGLALAWDIRWL